LLARHVLHMCYIKTTLHDNPDLPLIVIQQVIG
jgi:hypothetical protein